MAALVLGFALVVLIAAFRPNRQYCDLPRGVFPEDAQQPKTQRESGGDPPLRPTKPEMSPAEAGYIFRDCDGAEMTLATIVDLASRRFLDIVEYQELALPRPTVVVVSRRPADETCTRQERVLLELFSMPGAAEAPDFVRARPFNLLYFRGQLQASGVSKLGSPSARVSGLRRSISELMGRDIARAAVFERKWYDRWREPIGSVGALMLLGGGLATLVFALLYFFAGTNGAWFVVSVAVAVAGALTFVGREGRTADGTVARDQAAGFRRFIVEAPVPPANARDLASLGGWAIALDCVDEWEQSIERLGESVTVEDAFPWLASTRGPLTKWRDVTDIVKLMQARIHAEQASRDARSPLPPMEAGWVGVESAW